jgi:hypothetical protein
MTHPRRKIREATKAAIVGAGTALADRVWPSREPPVNVEAVLMQEGPVGLIYTRRDRKLENSPSGSGWEWRSCELFVELTVAGGDVLDDKLDDLAEVIEPIIDGLEIPGMPSAEIRHIETEIETSQEFEMPVGGALLRYEAKYFRSWRTEDDDEFDCPIDVGLVVNGGPRERIDVECPCEDEP